MNNLATGMNEISLDDFNMVEMCAGTILSASLNPKARKPAYKLTIDFGNHGIKTSSAQLTENYSADDLVGKQIIAVMNFPSMRIAGVKSEVLVLASVCDDNGTVLLSPTSTVENGCRVS